jgi:23S rRNA (pseudouridine1915-N3)-methyltransferase
MRIHLLSVGTRMTGWVEAGFAEYARRLPPECRLRLVEIPPVARGKGEDSARVVRKEGERLLAGIPPQARTLALEVGGRLLSTEEVARELRGWLQGGRDVALLVGGPDGLDPACLERAESRWSLSPLTFPHPLVRVIVAEQLYRAWSLLHNHPYHRA